jgi:hypothetical protein
VLPLADTPSRVPLPLPLLSHLTNGVRVYNRCQPRGSSAARNYMFREVVVTLAPVILNLSYELMLRVARFVAKTTKGFAAAGA